MIEVRQTDEFAHWLDRLRDTRAKARIIVRIQRAAGGNLGDVRSVGGGVSEMRIDVGPGYRAYFIHRPRVMIVLLCGGDKSSQDREIKRAKALAREIP
jgi:putative addiction module killer protein